MHRSVITILLFLFFGWVFSGCARSGYVPLEDMRIDYKTLDKQQKAKNYPQGVFFWPNVPGPDEPLMHKKRSFRKQKRMARKRSKKLQWEKWPPGKKGFFSWLIFWK